MKKRILSMLLAIVMVVGLMPGFSITASAATTTGTTGDCTWSFDDATGTLTISGEGEMANYQIGQQPWYAYSSSLTEVVIESGVTYVGNFAFTSYSTLARLELPDTLTDIGSYAFYGCSSLNYIEYWGTTEPTKIGASAFRDCDASIVVKVPTNYNGDDFAEVFIVNKTLVPSATTTYSVLVSANPTEGGTVSGGGTYEENTSATVTAAANPGYTFVNWTKNGEQVSEDVTYTFTPTADSTLVANFEKLPEAAWGTSASDLPNSGTLEDAIAAATAANSTVKYIQLQSNITREDEIRVTSGNFTIDLNGKRWESSETALYIGGTSEVTIDDTATGGTLITDESNYCYAIVLYGSAKLEIAGGTIRSSDRAVAMHYSGIPTEAELTVSGGELISTDKMAISAFGNKVTISGGEITSYSENIYWKTGTIDLFGHKDPAGISFYFDKDNASMDDISLPDDYYIYDQNNPNIAVSNLELYKAYTIGKAKYTVTVSANPTEGGTVSGGDTYEEGASVTVTATPATGYKFTGWTEDGKAVEDADATYTFEASAGRTLVANFTKIEAKWGADANSLDNSGTLEQAIAAATAGNAAYIQLQSNITRDIPIYIETGSFTIDLNGNEWKSSEWALYIHNESEVKIADTATGGTLITEEPSYPTIKLYGKLEIAGGTISGRSNAVNMSQGGATTEAELTVSGGNLISTGSNAISAYGNEVTISGGKITSFLENIYWKTGTIDLSGYENPTDISFYTHNSSTEMSMEKIKLPDGYCIYGKNNPNTAVLNLEPDKAYIIGKVKYTVSVSANPTEGGTVSGGDTVDAGTSVTVTATPADGYKFTGWTEGGTTVSTNASYTFTASADRTLAANFEKLPEAAWGTSASDLPNSGTLEQALAAATAADSTVKYIQLQSDITREDEIRVTSGNFTIDLNGKRWESSKWALYIGGESEVKIDDTVTDGTLITEDPSCPAIMLYGSAKLEIAGGTISGLSNAVNMSQSGNTTKAELTVSGGKLISTGRYAIYALGNNVIISGGTITSYLKNIYWKTGTIDLFDHENPTGISFICDKDNASMDDIKLPDGYCIYDSNNTAVESLVAYKTYTIGKVKYTVTVSANPADGGTVSGGGAVEEGASVTVTAVPADGYKFTGWTEGGKAVEDADATYTFEASADRNLAANFTKIEAAWGTSASDLPNSGTLDEAITAATKGNAAYIQLQSDVSRGFTMVTSGNFTIDLNGKRWESSEWGLLISGKSEVTIDDTATGGTLITEETIYTAIALYGSAKLEIAGGTISGWSGAVNMSFSGDTTDAKLTVSGGKLISTGSYAISAYGNKVIISGGEITSGREDIYWKTGTIDLSGHENPTDISFRCAIDNASMDDIKLPDGYCIYDQNNPNTAVSNLELDKTYIIGKAKYTITFDTDGGSQVGSITQEADTKINAPADPTKTGYTFKGWDTEIPTTMPAENMTIKATWQINQYTITFDTDGGSDVAPITQDYGAPITAPADPTKTGYTFKGWEPAIPETMPAENVTVTALWTEKENVSVDETVQRLTYDGSSKAFAITGTELTGFTVTYQQNGAEAAPINAGTYDVIITRAEDDTCKKFEMTIEGGLVINKATVPSNSFTFTAPADLVYSKTAKAATVTGDSEYGAITINYYSDSSLTTEVTPINAGTYYVGITTAGGANYNAVTTPTNVGVFTITAKPVTVTADDKEAYVGDRMPELTFTVSGLIGDDAISVGLSCDARMNRAGETPIVVTAADPSGNYEIITVNGTLTVEYYIPAIPSIPSAPTTPTTPSNPTYPPVVDGGSNGDVTVSPRNPDKGDIVTVTTDPDKGYEVDKVIVTDKNGKPVTVVDNGDGTYSFKQPNGKVNIEVTFTEINEITDITDVDEVETPEKICTLDNTCPMYGYTDLDMTAWYHDGVHFCLENGLMNGTSADTFAPGTATSRAMIVTILWRLEGEPVVNYAMSFKDVAADTWYTEAVRWAQANKIVLGYSDEAFGPGDAITREQLATILYRYEQYKGGGFTGAWMIRMDYADLEDVSDWAYEAMCWMNMNGIVNGKPGKILDPKGSASRAEAATMLYRYCEVMTKDDEN